ncbi:thermonuclease family protein [Pseudomonas rhodesiae]|uniref:thermonuclease family protein n=1 Tax=Pseudomonas rhodesiae TaxID=76760 RepID=UPI00209F3366|nr:thermonuclease family protein [Pseudomonas rhodesiae]MCP1515565.1 endonuclease YncB(thermonuclease family) [Pseudomonas rhodesiae]MDF9772968.1 endonuclease YncB(thermonuclease family) [Pseudomonas rhodesiae]
MRATLERLNSTTNLKAFIVTLKRSLTILLLATSLAGPLIGWAGENFRALTVAVLDGDTVEVLTEQHKKIRIRLAGIDAPEKSQAYGQRSKQNLASMVAGKSVDVIDHGSDQYGRTVGSLFVDGLDVNAEQVKAGYAWVYTRYNRDSMLPTLEENARRDQLGLWRDPNPTAPWEFRHSR